MRALSRQNRLVDQRIPEIKNGKKIVPRMVTRVRKPLNKSSRMKRYSITFRSTKEYILGMQDRSEEVRK